MSTNTEEIDTKDMDIEIHNKFVQAEQENQNDKLITLDLATFDKIPQQLYILINDVCNSIKNYTQFDVLNACVIYCAIESSFIGDWMTDIDLSNYTLNWCSAFNRRILEQCTFPSYNYNKNCNNNSLMLTFKFTLEQSRKIVLNSVDSGDIAIINVYEIKNLDKTQCIQTKSVAIPVSRYIPYKKLCDNLPNSFRNLAELSRILKEKLFLPIRNILYEDCAVLPTPWINGLPECVLVKILKYLNKKDLHSLKCTCRKQYDICKAFASNKKRKFE